MKRIVLIVISGLLCILTIAMRPVEGQSNLQDRVAALETRVAQLETASGASQPTQQAPGVTHTINGSLTIFATRSGSGRGIDVLAGNRCQGTGGYSDLRIGSNVTVRDGAGTIVAVSKLEDGQFTAGSVGEGTCRLPFTISGVPEMPFYSIEIGRRSGYSISLDQLLQAGWTLDLSIGD